MKLHICTWSAQYAVWAEDAETTARTAQEEDLMGEDHVYKKIELVHALLPVS